MTSRHHFPWPMLRAWLLVAAAAVGYAALLCLVAALVLGTDWWWLGLIPPAVMVVSAEAIMLLINDETDEFEVVGMDRAPRLHAVVDRLCALTGQEKPELRRFSSPLPNALSRAARRARPTVLLSDSLLRDVDPQYLEPVLAHELAHLGHRDEKALEFAEAMAGGWLIFAAFAPVMAIMHLDVFVCALARMGGYEWERLAKSRAARRLDERLPKRTVRPRLAPWLLALALLARAVVVCLFLASLVVPLAGFLLYLVVCWPGFLAYRVLCRRRELAVDRAAADLTGRPSQLAAALTTMSDEAHIPEGEDLRGVPKPAAKLAILPFPRSGGGTPGKGGFLARLFASHPPVDRRIAQLEVLSRGGSARR